MRLVLELSDDQVAVALLSAVMFARFDANEMAAGSEDPADQLAGQVTALRMEEVERQLRAQGVQSSTLDGSAEWRRHQEPPD